MDLKLILILLILCIALGLFVKDYLNFKKKILLQSEETNTDVKVIKNRLNLITNEIKTYNNDLIMQFKKINTINSQKITSMANYYTESETNENLHLVEYLSENNNNLKINFRDILSDVSHTIIDNPLINVEDNKFHPKIIQLDSATSSDTSLKSKQNHIDNISESSKSSKSSDSAESKSSSSSKSNKSTKSLSKPNDTIQFDTKTKTEPETTETNPTPTPSPDNFNHLKTTDSKTTDSKTNDSKTTESESLSNMKNIGPIHTYSKTDLENIAKIHLISLTYQDGTQRKAYKKEELYNKIKIHFENLKNNII